MRVQMHGRSTTGGVQTRACRGSCERIRARDGSVRTAAQVRCNTGPRVEM